MSLKKEILIAEKEIVELGYSVKYEATNKNKPNQIQQMHIYKNDNLIARMSLMLACRIDTMHNGVGRNERELLKILVRLSMTI